MLSAPLPSAPDVGDGWRGVDLRRIHPLDQFDPLVIETASRSEAAIGVHVEGSFAYVIAAARDEEPVRLVLGVDPSAPPHGAAEVFVRSGVTGTGARWRKRAAKAFERWSSNAPRSLEADAVLALLGPEHPPIEAVSWLAALLGLRLTNEPIPDPLDLQSLARRHAGSEPKNARRRWFSRGR
jgi:hypothetical protein